MAALLFVLVMLVLFVDLIGHRMTMFLKLLKYLQQNLLAKCKYQVADFQHLAKI